MLNRIIVLAILPLFLLMFSACEKKTNGIGENPYAGGKESFGIKFTGDAPIPESAIAGSTVTFIVHGVKKWADDIEFRIANEKAAIIDITDTTVIVKVPDNVSSGLTSIILGEQVFYGPRFRVLGNVTIDPSFGARYGTDGPIFDFYEYNNGYLLAGDFSNYERDWYYNRMAFINKQGILSHSIFIRGGANAAINSISRLSGGQFIISGYFNTFSNGKGISAITRLKTDGSLDVSIVDVINLTPENPNNGKDTVAAFNGGVPNQSLIKSFVTSDNKVIAVGNFKTYGRVDYTKSTRAGKFYNYTDVRSVIRMDENGKLDVDYHKDLQGANGPITDAYLQSDGKIVIVGDFTQFDGHDVNRIVRLDKDGNYDASFLTGSGANGVINMARYNPVVKKTMITGSFNTFDGIPYRGIALLNEDGSLEKDFVLRPMEGGFANFAKYLNSGKILVAGNFEKYANVTRPGFLLLDPDGSVSQNFNVAGTFEGQIYQVVETTSATGNPALLLIGNISKFDDLPVKNIVRVEIKN